MAYISSSMAETFGTLTAGADITMSHFSLIADYGEASELVIATGAFSTERTYTATDPLEMPMQRLRINLPNGALQDAAVKAAWDALLADKSMGITMSLGTADMTATGKANEIPTSRGYSRQVVEVTTGLGTAPVPT